MKQWSLSNLIAFFLLWSCSSGFTASKVNADTLICKSTHCYYLPVQYKSSPTLIINHNNIDITQIPDEWLVKAKQLTFHYAHTSHGGQILEGMQYLESYDDKYAFATSSGVTPTLPAGSGLLKLYDGNSYSSSYIEPQMFWSATDGVNHTLSTANTGFFNYSMWSWCGQADTSDASYIDSYLAQMSAFEAAFPDMRFILMTGHNVSSPGTNLLARNQQIRDYAIAHNMILFDFADIETYDPDGGFHDPVTINYIDGNCTWCQNWCDAAPDHQVYCTNLPDCAHTHGLFCKMKAQAFWWMMARLAGWSG